MRRSFIVEAVRLPIGQFGGAYKDMRAQNLGAIAIKECIERSGVDSGIIDEVIVGNIMQYEPKGNPGREAWLEAGLSINVPAFTINKNCGSSIRAISLASSLIKASEGEIFMAVGMENMTACPYLLRKARYGYRMGDGVISDSLTDGLVGMGMTAERLADKYNITRSQQDEFAYKSQMKAKKAIEDGVFQKEIVPVRVYHKNGEYILKNDQGVKTETTIESLAKLRPVFKREGTVTPGNSSTINDGAAALLIMSEDKVGEYGLKPLAEIISYASSGCDPDIMGIGPVPATQKALKIAGLRMENIDFIELNEAFAAQALAVIKELGMDIEKVNINGSGISLGHPVGATGAIIVTKLIYQLRRSKKTYGLATMCIGGGQGVAIVIKNPEA